jgi:hypothetical protein
MLCPKRSVHLLELTTKFIYFALASYKPAKTMKKATDQNQDLPGILKFEKDDIVFTFNNEEVIRFSFYDVIVIGEMTLGPETRFLVFVEKEEMHYSIPYHFTGNMNEFLTQLYKRLNYKFPPSVFHSQLDTNIVYPLALAGRKVYHIITEGYNGEGFEADETGIKLQLILTDEVINYKPVIN